MSLPEVVAVLRTCRPGAVDALYADDFLLGFVGPRREAEEARQKLGEFLAGRLRLTLSPSKTLITHAVSGRARFLGYDVGVLRGNTYLTTIRKGAGAKARTRAANGKILLEMPQGSWLPGSLP
jgi:hypothetical protein